MQENICKEIMPMLSTVSATVFLYLVQINNQFEFLERISAPLPLHPFKRGRDKRFILTPISLLTPLSTCLQCLVQHWNSINHSIQTHMFNTDSPQYIVKLKEIIIYTTGRIDLSEKKLSLSTKCKMMVEKSHKTLNIQPE